MKQWSYGGGRWYAMPARWVVMMSLSVQSCPEASSSNGRLGMNIISFTMPGCEAVRCWSGLVPGCLFSPDWNLRQGAW